MPDLFDLQCDFASFVRGEEPTSLLRNDIVPMGLPPAARLSVHRNNHRLSLTSVLAGMYPVTLALVGEDFFTAVARQFIAAHPPQSPALIDYGHDWPDFLDRLNALADMRWIADVAHIEAARSAVYHEADDAPLDPEHLQSMDENQIAALVLRPIAALRLINSDWPVHRIWDAHQPDAHIKLEDVNLDSGPINLLIYRHDFEIRQLPLSNQAADLLTLLADGIALGDAVTRAQDDGTALGHLFGLTVLKMET